MNPHRVRLSPIILLLLAAATLFVAVSCADKSSSEACRFETTMNLDKGNYDAVLASPCANAQQKGAAYFGKAGFSAIDVINRFIDANSGTSGQSDLNLYLSDMIGAVTDTTIGYLDSAHDEYRSLSTADAQFRDAMFSLSLVDAIRALALLKYIVEGSGLGTLNENCDMNSNSNPDELDASSCALYVSGGQSCSTLNSGGTVTVTSDVPNLTFSGKNGTYRGLVVTVSGTGTNISGCPSPNAYKRLLFQSGTDIYPTATAANLCRASDGQDWPCPLELDGQPVDLVSTVDESLTSAVDSLSSSLTSSTDVTQSITDIKTEACPSGTCTSADIATYLQSY